MFDDLRLINQHRRHSKVTLSEVLIRERKLQQLNIDIIVTFRHNEYKKASRHEKNKYFSTLKNVWSHPNISSKKIWDFTKLIIAPVGLARHLLSF